MHIFFPPLPPLSLYFLFVIPFRSNNSFFLPSIFLSTFLFLSSLVSLHFHSNLSLLLILPKKNFLPSPSFSSSSSFSPFLPSSTNIQLFISSEYKFIQPLLPSISLPPSFVHRSLPLSSPNTPSTSSLSSSPSPPHIAQHSRSLLARVRYQSASFPLPSPPRLARFIQRDFVQRSRLDGSIERSLRLQSRLTYTAYFIIMRCTRYIFPGYTRPCHDVAPRTAPVFRPGNTINAPRRAAQRREPEAPSTFPANSLLPHPRSNFNFNIQYLIFFDSV